jgi:ATP-dependent protease ClpP protease subunit
MCHQFSEEAEGKYHDIKAHMKEADLCNQRMVNILCEATGLDVKTVKNKLLPPTDSWLKAEQLISLGVADSIL